jgi:23S rRNA pseudouridine2605 synthase
MITKKENKKDSDISTFDLQRVQKIIADSGYCSRRKAEILIDNGRVKVNDKIIHLGDKANLNRDTITIDGEKIKSQKKVYYMMNKPKDYITTTDDLYGRRKVLDIIPTEERIYPVGRLDRDAQGLLILTNDGDFANKVMHPSNNVPKTYEATIKTKFNKEDKIKLERGVYIDNILVKSKVRIINDYKLEIVLHVGVHKVVKRILKEIGYYVKHLNRTRIGNLKLDINPGEFRKLTNKDIAKIFERA